MLKQSVPLKIVKQANQEKSWDTLVYYMWLRSKYKKKIFYNYTSRSIAQHLGISHTQANYHIRKMIKLGWATTEKGNLFLLQNKKYIRIIPIQIYQTKREQVVALKNILINNNLFSQRKKIIKKTQIVSNAQKVRGKISKSDMKFIRKSGGVANLEKSITDRTTLSNKKIGQIFKQSKRQGSRLQVEMKNMGLLQCESHFTWVNGDYYNLKPNVFVYRGYLVERGTNTLFPIIVSKSNSLQCT
jgi:hypothetical protein